MGNWQAPMTPRERAQLTQVRVPGNGPLDSEVLVVGERPGENEAREQMPFVGKSGIELFGGWTRQERPKGSGRWTDVYETGRFERIVGLQRDQVRVENLVRTWHWEPPTPEEIARDEDELLDVIVNMTHLRVIVACGVHAARWFIGRPLTGDLMNGVPHWWDSRYVRPFAVQIVPVIHPAAALRSPDLNQSRLSQDLRAVKRVLTGALTARTFKTAAPITIHPVLLVPDGAILGFDGEGTPDDPEAIQLAWGDETCCVYAGDRSGLRLVQRAMDHAEILVAHYGVYDIKIAQALGLRLRRPVDDTMLAAFVLAEAQGVKDLAYRHLGLDLPEYSDLVDPLDDARCRAALRRHLRRLRLSPALFDVITEARVSPKTGKPLTPKVSRTPANALAHKHLASVTKALANPEPGVRTRWRTSTVLGALDAPPVVTWKDLPDETREPYGCTDPWLARTMWQQFAPAMQRRGVDRVYTVTRDILPMIARMETAGMQIDVPYLRRFTTRLETRYYRVCADLSELTGEPVNPRASEEVSALLFDRLYVEATKKTKSGKHFTTDDKYLKARKSSDRTSAHAKAVIGTILAARKIWKIKSTYCDGVLTAQRDGVLYPNLTYTRVVTGRFSAKEPNVLALPKHSDDAKLFRQAFVARPGHVLLSSDLSQIELRVAAHLSGDPILRDEYLRGLDKHQETVHKVLKGPAKKEDTDEGTRRVAKNLNFAVLMGTTEFGLTDQLHEQGLLEWDVDGSRAALDAWYETYHYVKEFNLRQHAFLKKHGYVVAPLSGRRRYIGAVHSTVPYIREAALREAQAFAYSTDAQFIMQTWMGRIWREVLQPLQRQRVYAEPWLQVHDDQLCEVHADAAEELRAGLERVLPQLLDIPTKTESKTGLSWGGL